MRWLVHHWQYFAPFFFLQFGFDFSQLTDALAAYYGAVIEFLLQVVQFIWSVLVYVANYIWSALNFIANFFYNLMQDIAKAFKWIWNTVIKTGLTKIVGTFLKVRAWLQNIFQPVIDFLKKLRAWYDKYFNIYVRPFLNLIRHLRQVLQIFRLLGFRWAARLDADLALIEQKIVQVYTLLRQQLNMVITYLDLIVDPLGILRRNPLFALLVSSAPELKNLLDTATIHPQTQSQIDASHRDRTWFTPEAATQNRTYFSQGQLPPDIAASRQQFIDAKVNPPDADNE